MTNRERISLLSDEEQRKAIQCYSKGVHPLYDYINWNAYWNSEDPNEYHFLEMVREVIDEKGNKYILIKEDVIKNGMDYMLIFRCSTNEMYYIPQTDDNYVLLNNGEADLLFEAQSVEPFIFGEDPAEAV